MDTSTPVRRLVLASASPRRREILDTLGLVFEVRPADIDETPQAGETPAATVQRLATEKAARVAMELADDVQPPMVIAADTVVELDGEPLGKPRDEEDARAMLRRLRDREHIVRTGLAVAWGRATEATVDSTAVVFGPMSTHEIGWYVSTGEPMDKAGAYAVQGLGALFVRSIAGSYHNVVGLPVEPLQALIQRHGVSWQSLPGR